MGVKVTSHVYDQYRKDIKCTLCIVRPVFFAENMCIEISLEMIDQDY
jgi:hypothetical protein